MDDVSFISTGGQQCYTKTQPLTDNFTFWSSSSEITTVRHKYLLFTKYFLLTFLTFFCCEKCSLFVCTLRLLPVRSGLCPQAKKVRAHGYKHTHSNTFFWPLKEIKYLVYSNLATGADGLLRFHGFIEKKLYLVCWQNYDKNTKTKFLIFIELMSLHTHCYETQWHNGCLTKIQKCSISQNAVTVSWA